MFMPGRHESVCGNTDAAHQPYFCNQCQSRRARLREIDRDKKRWQTAAIAKVSYAKRIGTLPKLDGSIPCTDCGAPASIYDHRDYSRPLDVDPVCRSCNIKRGTAAWPSSERYQFKRMVPAKPAEQGATKQEVA